MSEQSGVSKLKWLSKNFLKLPIYLLKAAFYLVLAAIILNQARYYFYKHNNPYKQWMYFATPLIRGRILIPEEIVKIKSCEKFFEWEYANIPLNMHGKCPWYEYTDVYPVKIGQVELEIPRKYLLLPAATNRYSNIITTESWIYPSMEIEQGRLTHQSFWITIKNRKEDDRYKNILHRFFYNLLDINIEFDEYKISYVNFNHTTKMNKYAVSTGSKGRVNQSSPIDYALYTNDKDIDNPKEFLVCPYSEYPSSICESVFKYKDIYINYKLNYSLLSNYKDIESQIIKMLNSWEVTDENKNR